MRTGSTRWSLPMATATGRCCVDETGALIRGDVLGILTAKFLGAETVVTPVTSNSSIEGTGYFRHVVRTKVGSPFVIAGMAEAAGIVVGFEANGGVLLGSDVKMVDARAELRCRRVTRCCRSLRFWAPPARLG